MESPPKCSMPVAIPAPWIDTRSISEFPMDWQQAWPPFILPAPGCQDPKSGSRFNRWCEGVHSVRMTPPVFWLLAACLFGGASLLAQPAFFRKDIPVGDRPLSIAVGDFNNDSKPDLVVGT